MRARSLAMGAVIIAITALMSIVDSASAQDPNFTSRVMVTWGARKGAVDWDAEGSLALVVLPQQRDHDFPRREIAVPDPAVIASTLSANLPDLSREEISFLADLFLEAFEPSGEGGILRSSFFAAPLMHVKTDGAEFLNGDPEVVFWDRSPPPSGATAQAGPEGVVLVLGEFHVQQNSSGAHSLPTSTFLLVEDTDTATAVQVAMGLFTK